MTAGEDVRKMDRARTLSLLATHGIRPNKRLGQNFLVDGKAAETIAGLSTAGPDDLVVEVGPGLGALTACLAGRAGRVLAVEIDRGLVPALQENLAGLENITMVRADFLECNLDDLTGLFLEQHPGGRVHVAANVPYYITTPILRKIMTELPDCPSMVFLVQKEAAARLTARPGSGEYGPMAVCLSAFYDTRIGLRVPPHAFYPQPGVDSVVVQALLKSPEPVASSVPRRVFMEMVDAAFSHRRKRLFNSMQSAGYLDTYQSPAFAEILDRMGLKESCRAEELSAGDYLELFRKLT